MNTENKNDDRLLISGVVRSQAEEDEAFLDWYIEQQPELTEEEQREELEKLNKCADYILKNKITPNMDGIY